MQFCCGPRARERDHGAALPASFPCAGGTGYRSKCAQFDDAPARPNGRCLQPRLGLASRGPSDRRRISRERNDRAPRTAFVLVAMDFGLARAWLRVGRSNEVTAGWRQSPDGKFVSPSSPELARPGSVRVGAFEDRGASMKMVAMQSLMAVVLAGALCVLAAISPPLQARTRAGGERVISQYCAPLADSADVHKFYCRMDG
jgi:hypothetical protein